MKLIFQTSYSRVFRDGNNYFVYGEYSDTVLLHTIDEAEAFRRAHEYEREQEENSGFFCLRRNDNES